MDLKAVLTEVQSSPAEDRLRLIEEVWDGLSAESADEPISEEELRELLDHRIEALEKNPDAVVPWEVVEARALKRFER